ncbi:MAG: glycosyl hydrolase [Gemmatimonadetes bacterium]|nr:glycosyl hydrolase [Gemmatimonadota bacterium]MYD61243.1 glycosyl hydrolase [Gemmatimonadota bacterium]MYK52905.1 glycosyl hydrolase [Gemmatimonadota bacterium]
MKVNVNIQPGDLKARLNRFFELAAQKIRSIDSTWDPGQGTPVFTAGGKYTTRGWTEWTQGFQFGCAILGYEITGEKDLLQIGRKGTLDRMASHVTHIGVHDHGFNNVSTYGNLRRLMREGIIPENEWEQHFYELALKASGAVQAARWTTIGDGKGYIHSFNGPHSLFSDTIRSCRALAVAHDLGHVLMGENDLAISLLERLIHHAETTAQFNVYYGEGRDRYDVRGRVVHESIFNVNDGNYRCPSTQQGYSPFSTWTRGLAWIVTGYAELLEYVEHLSDDALDLYGGRDAINGWMLKAACATADYYIDSITSTDGIPLWDAGAPGLIEGYGDKISDPYNTSEPVDSSAAAIAAQGLYRLGKYMDDARYRQAALTVAHTLFDAPYLSEDEEHQGLILHSIYHNPNGWDYVPGGQKVACGESSMWGDYHAMELAVLLQREMDNAPYLTFFDQ